MAKVRKLVAIKKSEGREKTILTDGKLGSTLLSLKEKRK